MSGKLYVVGTPIGNLDDFSARGKAALENVDFIAAEDTRVSVKLLNRCEIKKPLLSYYEHNKNSRLSQITDRILNGESCALISDAGMPAISDPGEDLVRECLKLGIPVESVPGPTAVTTALAISGMSTKRWCFEGFLSQNTADREQHLSELKNERRTICLYEAPHKLLSTLKDLYEFLGQREIAIVRELTKIHEEVAKTTLSDAIEFYTENDPKGEYVLIIEGATRIDEHKYSLEEAVLYAKQLMQSGNSASAAAKAAAVKTGFKKSDIYRLI